MDRTLIALLTLMALQSACSGDKASQLVVKRSGSSKALQTTQKGAGAKNGDVSGSGAVKEHSPRVATNLDGAALYAQNCATCHGPLGNSKKHNATASEIADAIKTIPQMAGLSGLTSAEIEKISTALLKGIALSATKGDNPFQCTPGASDVGPATPIRRLTRAEAVAVYRDLFSKYLTTATLREVSESQPEEGSDGIFDNKATAKTYGHVFASYKAASLASRELAASSSFRSDYGRCSKSDDACNSAVIDGAASRILRRAVPATEKARYVALAKDAGGGDTGLGASLLALLASPSFLHRIELGGVPDANGVSVLDAYELASRLAFVTTGTLPDSALWAKAVNGTLLDEAVYGSEVERLTATEAFAARVSAFFENLSGINSNSHTYSQAFLSGLDGGTVINQANDEFRTFVKDLVFASGGSYRDLLTSTKVVSMGNQVASIYLADISGSAQANMSAGKMTPPGGGTALQSWLIADFQFPGNPPEMSKSMWTPHGPNVARRAFRISQAGDVRISFDARGEPLDNVPPNAVVRLYKMGASTPHKVFAPVPVTAVQKAHHDLPPLALEVGDYVLELSTNNDLSRSATENRNVWYFGASLEDATSSGAAASPSNVAPPATLEKLSADRAGLFGRVAFLLSKDDQTHLVHRGLLVRRNFLCEELQLPDLDTVGGAANLAPPAPSAEKSIMVQIKERTSSAACASCHSKINPPGFVLEAFDGIGRMRSQELVFDPQGKVVARHPVATSIPSNVESAADPAVTNMREMAEVMVGSSKAPACLTQRWLEYAAQRPVHPRDSCLLHDLYGVMQSEGEAARLARYPGAKGQVRSMFTALLLSPAFRAVRK